MSVRNRSRSGGVRSIRTTVALAILGITGLLALVLGTAAQDASSQAPPRGNDAFSAFYPGPEFSLPNSTLLTVGRLEIPEPGNYVVDAKLEAWNSARVDGRGIARCSVAPRRAPEDPPRAGEGDMSTIDLQRDWRGMIVMQFAHRFDAPGEVLLRCLDSGTSLVKMSQVWITATQVDSLTKTRFVP
jgi:hypothetical protein